MSTQSNLFLSMWFFVNNFWPILNHISLKHMSLIEISYLYKQVYIT